MLGLTDCAIMARGGGGYTLSQHRYSWLITAVAPDGALKTIQVNGDEVRIGPNGVLYFFGPEKAYLVAAFSAQAWREFEIMSQVTGGGNGFLPISDGSLLDAE